jgi:hypothetical protein
LTSSLIALAGNDTRQLSRNRTAQVSAIDFPRDIVSDAQGINIFRLQLILFTLFTGYYFVSSVITEMMFPVFDTYFLVLFGFSHFIYLTFIFWANKKKL